MSAWLTDVQAGIGRRGSWVALGAVVAGAAAFATGLGAGDAPRTFAALIASWLFFAGLAAGALAYRAFFHIVAARWVRPMARLGGIAIGFAPATLVILVVIVAGSRIAPWLGPEADTVWLGTAFLTVRQLVLSSVLFGIAFVSIRRGADGSERPPAALAVVYLLVFAVVLSTWAFDFVLAPDPAFQSTVMGPFVFVGAFLAGTGLVTLLAVARGRLGDVERRDASALLLALSILWAYLFWSQYLTVWYGNLPEEIEFALRRAANGWGAVVLAVIGLVFAVPFLTLLHPRGRRSAIVLVGLLVTQLVGLWLTCHLLVVPSLAGDGSPPLGVRDVLVALGLLGAFALSIGGGLARAQRAESRS
jgi:hypothetical protein